MEEKPFKASAKSSVKSNPHKDIRNLWTTATLSQPKMNVQLSNVYRDSELKSSSVGSKTRGWYNQKNASHHSDGGWEEWDDGDDNVSFKQEELDDHTLLELHPGSSFGSHLEEEDDSSTEMEITSSMPSLSILKHTPHQAYWVEQQTRVGGIQGDGILVGWGMGMLEVAGVGVVCGWRGRQVGWGLGAGGSRWAISAVGGAGVPWTSVPLAASPAAAAPDGTHGK
ncbi:cation channel sperm-associated auxiliary subunit zeta isoform X2 [Rhinolophus ferrumequinum]|uniref:cation channel sperm-associated auxiliary subunit zeta isoform X2 n=1 Tax=Rhinolophus ferrumequinum TaxID=59479 RepID=UPI00140FE475|nr:cation channel sperm-associated auxiliary subunit zeta isoform X2 [Rhinolophus ferrumequinum]